MLLKEKWYRCMMLLKDLDSICEWIAWHMPKRLVLWCFIRVAANASYIFSDKEIGTMTVDDMIEGWKNEKYE